MQIAKKQKLSEKEFEELVEAEQEEEEEEVSEDEHELDYFHSHFGNDQSEAIGLSSLKVDANQFVVEAAETQYGRMLKKQISDKFPPIEKETLAAFGVQKRFHDGFRKANKKMNKKGFTQLQQPLFEYFNNYQDFYFCKSEHKHQDAIRNVLALHVLNHVYKTRNLVLKTNAKLKKQDVEIRDQGFTRPKILVLLPFKNHCYEFVNALMDISGTTIHENKKRFQEEFQPPEGDGPDPRKSDDFNQTFKGNIDDHFRLGIKFDRKKMKMYAPFFSCDILVASPLGLKTIIGEPGDRKREFDYLSSIEVVVMNHAEIFLNQNWDHVRSIFDHLNLIPKEAHGCDFSRVRSYYLDEKAKYVRQNIFFSAFQFPELNALIHSYCKNMDGSIKITDEYKGSLSDVVVQIPQVFQRIPKSTIQELPVKRFEFFKEKILPMLHSNAVQKSHVLIVVPSYFDFVRIRNYMKDHNYNFAAISEYSTRSQVDRSRHYFKQGETKLMLYSERAHFFRRYKIPSTVHLVFYQPPTFPFYSEFVNLIENTQDGFVQCLYSQYDKLALERIVGSTRCSKMITNQKDAYMFTI
ncbi:hypothetical protein EDD86DRAFT_205755 [Gorgonomyces haynaldii]|nr:hypothetical protein EDD86DRAFT_205755 [Gorgonomyces haynaldii]